jgi:hypothetical protein
MTGVSIDGCFVRKPGGLADAVVIDAISATATATAVNTEYVRNLIAAPSCVVVNPTTSRFRQLALAAISCSATEIVTLPTPATRHKVRLQVEGGS